jgi:photosystem II stability/assembly factor-like uncharacterized protein
MCRRFLASFAVLIFVLAASAVVTSTQASPSATWVNVTGNLANMASECGNSTMVSPVPGSNTIMAGIALRGLWANSSGSTWSHLGDGAGSDTITNRPSWIVHDPANPAIFWESGIYNGGGIYKTTDSGNTFHRLGSISHNDYVSVDFTDPNRQTLLAGGHEQSQTVYRSTNGGQTWTNIGATLPANTKFSTIPLVVNAQTYLVNAQGYSGTIAGIYRTTNGGASWQQVSTVGPPGPPLVASNGAIYWAAFGFLLKSTDAGATWTQVGNNLAPIRPVELPGGTLVAVGGGKLMASADNGSTWSAISPTLPFTPVSMMYSPNRRAFFISYFDCGAVVPPNAIMTFDYGVSTPAPAAPTNLRIVSGNED